MVSREKQTCMVCLKQTPTGGLLITKSKPRVEWGLCPDHARMKDRNLIAMVEVDPTKSMTYEDNSMLPGMAHRTGTVVYLSRSAFRHIFYGETPDNGVCFVQPEVVAMLQRLEQLLKQDNLTIH